MFTAFTVPFVFIACAFTPYAHASVVAVAADEDEPISCSNPHYTCNGGDEITLKNGTNLEVVIIGDKDGPAPHAVRCYTDRDLKHFSRLLPKGSAIANSNGVDMRGDEYFNLNTRVASDPVYVLKSNSWCWVDNGEWQSP